MWFRAPGFDLYDALYKGSKLLLIRRFEWYNLLKSSAQIFKLMRKEHRLCKFWQLIILTFASFPYGL